MSENHDEKHVHAYDRMMERVKESVELGEEKAIPTLAQAIETAREKAVELGELSREEAERIGDYLRRDLEDAGHFLSEAPGEIKDWLRFDIDLIEARLLDVFAQLADRTRVELAELAEQAKRYGEWRTGEVTGIGTLECKGCGEHIHFHKSGHVPPCPKCRGTTYRRIPFEE